MNHTRQILTLAAITAASISLNVSAQTAWNGYSFQAGLSDITTSTALTTTNTAAGIAKLTDGSVDTGVANVGFAGGVLIGDFGGGSYYHQSAADIVLVGAGNVGYTNLWGGFTISLQLSDSSFTPGIVFPVSDPRVLDGGVNPNAISYFQNYDGSTVDAGAGLSEYIYLPLDISSFDTGGLGVTGIELSAMTSQFPDLSYIGVTGPGSVPEPGTLALAALGGAGWLSLRRRK